MTAVAPGTPRRNLHRQIVHALGRRILQGKIQPGDALQAAETMAASRTALREAIKVLTAKGLVEAKPKIGTRVTPRESWNLLDPDVMAWQHDGTPRRTFLKKLTEVRAVIEPQAAAFAAERASATDVKALESAYRDMEAAFATTGDDVEAFVEADMRFHLTILRACGNELLEQMTRVVYSALIVSFSTTSRLPGSARRSLPKHHAILQAIAAGHPARARAAMQSLVAETAREIGELPDGDVNGATGRQDRDRDGRGSRDRSRDRREARIGRRARHLLRSRARPR
jgi:DNA-binding FadR family transcriptional regulator